MDQRCSNSFSRGLNWTSQSRKKNMQHAKELWCVLLSYPGIKKQVYEIFLSLYFSVVVAHNLVFYSICQNVTFALCSLGTSVPLRTQWIIQLPWAIRLLFSPSDSIDTTFKWHAHITKTATFALVDHNLITCYFECVNAHKKI